MEVPQSHLFFILQIEKSRREEPLVDGWIISPPPLAEPESLGHFESLGHPLFQHSLDDADLTDVEEEDEEEEEEETKKEKQVNSQRKPSINPNRAGCSSSLEKRTSWHSSSLQTPPVLLRPASALKQTVPGGEETNSCLVKLGVN